VDKITGRGTAVSGPCAGESQWPSRTARDHSGRGDARREEGCREDEPAERRHTRELVAELALVDRFGSLARAMACAAAAVSVCAEALRHQNAERDAEIALVLRRGAGDRLAQALEELRELERRLLGNAAGPVQK
jgi:hypothetical protein